VKVRSPCVVYTGSISIILTSAVITRVQMGEKSKLAADSCRWCLVQLVITSFRFNVICGIVPGHIRLILNCQG
jgi:TRAP-type mannitol/chloroaromatic compound transport system permease small subunit